MPRIQTFISDDAIAQINGIIRRRLGEGASAKEVNLSSITGMLVELGLKVYQREGNNKEDVFDQDRFNKVLLESAVASRLQTAKILAALKLLPELDKNEVFDLMKIKSETESTVRGIVEGIFQEEE